MSPAEGLRSDHRSDHVSIHIDVAMRHAPSNVRGNRLDARVDAKRQRGVVCGNIVEQSIESVRTPANDMKNRPKDLFLEVARAVEPDDRWGNICASRRKLFFQTKQNRGLRVHCSDPAVELALGFSVD